MVLFLSLITLLLFQGMLSNFIPIFNYFEEFILLLLLVLSIKEILLEKTVIKLYKIEIIAGILLVFIFIQGIISNIVYGIVENSMDYLISGLLFLKPFLFYYLTRFICQKLNINCSLLQKYSNFINIILSTYTLIIILNIPIGFLEVFDIRYGIIETVSVGFSHPAELDFLAISLTIIQLFLYCFLKKDLKKYNIVLILSFIIIIFSGRNKSLIFLFTFICIYTILRKNIEIKYIFSIIPILYLITKERLHSEFIQTGSARGTLYKYAFEILKDFFPLGSGFGTYGTDYSRINYSPLYYYYNINDIYGLSPTYSAFITDAHWAGVIGELGIVGLILYIILIVLFTILFMTYIEYNKILNLSVYSLWGYMIFASLSDTIMTAYRGCAVMIISAFIISILKKCDNSEQCSEPQ